MTILITGATGSVGRQLVDILIERDVPVRALTRDPAVANLPASIEVVEGSLATAPTSSFAGVDAIFLFPADDGVDGFVDRAIQNGVARFVVLSSLAVSGRNARDFDSATALHHRAVEQAVTRRTDDWTILRPGNFAKNLLFWAYAIRSGFPVRSPFPTSSQVLIDEADIAAAAAIVLTEPEHEGRIYELTGPESLTRKQQLDAIGTAVGRDLTLVETTPEQFRTEMAQYMPGDIIDMLLRYWSETVDEPEAPLPPALPIIRTTLDQWARVHRAAFGG